MAKFTLILSLVLISFNSAVGGDNILNRKILSEKRFSCKDISSVNLFIDDNNNIFIQVGVSGENRYGNYFLYTNKKWNTMVDYGRFLNGLIKDGHFYLAFQKEDALLICGVREDISVSHNISIADAQDTFGSTPYFERVIGTSGDDYVYYALGCYVKAPSNPIDRLKHIASGGHGTWYRKPFLAKISQDKVLQYEKLKYGGRKDESYLINKTTLGKNMIHLLGFRAEERPGNMGQRGIPGHPSVLYYNNYDFTRNNTIQKISIYEKTPKIDLYYGPLSMDNLNDDVFVVFSWLKQEHFGAGFDIKYTTSEIYYCQSSGKDFSKVEKITNGFLPLVRVNSHGMVYVFWINSDGKLFYKTQKEQGWSKEQQLTENIDIFSQLVVNSYIDATFDSGDNLHLAYPSDGNIIYEKLQVN